MYEDLIKVLRCELYGDDECDRSDCPIWSSLGCRSGISNRAAADALEAAEQRIDCLKKLVDINTERCEALRKQLRESHENYEKHLNELEAQMPKWVSVEDYLPDKHGEWEWDEARCIYRCSKCKSPKAREDMDRNPVKEQSFCHNCGAKMRGEHDE